MLSHSLIDQDRAHLIHPSVSLRAHERRCVTILSITASEDHLLVERSTTSLDSNLELKELRT